MAVAGVATTLPLFLLNTVLFPGGPLPLRVFEPRYLGLVSRCLREDIEFGVVLVLDRTRDGMVETATVGTTARIIDWYQGSDGLLGITALGGRRFRLGEVTREPDGLNLGSVDFLPPPPVCNLPAEFQSMAKLLEAIIADLGKLYESVDKRYDDADWVGCRLAEILPMDMEDKQRCLEESDPLARLKVLRPMLRPQPAERPQ
jgi:uncharacterized protein